MVKKYSRSINFVLMMGLLLTSCTNPVPEASTQEAVQEVVSEEVTSFTVTDGYGREVVFSQAPERVVQAGRAAIMLVDAIYLFPEASDRLVAMTKVSQGVGSFAKVVDPNFEDKTIQARDVSPEQVASVQPDAVVMKSFMRESLGNPLEDLGIPVVYLDFETPEQYQRDLITLGQLFQDEARAEMLVDYYQERVDQVAEPLADLSEEEKPSVLVLYYSDTDGEIAFNVPPMNWMQTILVETAGGDPIWKDIELGGGWNKVNFEQIAAWDPDQIYLVSYFVNADEVVASLKEDQQWQALRAVQESQLYSFPADYYSWDQPDVRWILGLNWLATKIHPDKFADLNIDQLARDFYNDLYGLDEAAFEEAIIPHLRGDLP